MVNSKSSPAIAYKNITLIAHSGGASYAPENTLAAITLAGKMGFKAVEFDIRPTKDGKWVVMHDETVDRMTNGSGKIQDYTLKQIKYFNIDAGTNIKDYADLKIPTLEEALDECKKRKLEPYIEIKFNGGVIEKETMSSLTDILKKKGFEKCAVLSFNIEQLKAVKELQDGHKPVYLTEVITPESIELAKSLGKNAVICFNAGKNADNPEKIRLISNAGLRAAAWTVDDKDTLDKLRECGIDNITTNKFFPGYF